MLNCSDNLSTSSSFHPIIFLKNQLHLLISDAILNPTIKSEPLDLHSTPYSVALPVPSPPVTLTQSVQQPAIILAHRTATHQTTQHHHITRTTTANPSYIQTTDPHSLIVHPNITVKLEPQVKLEASEPDYYDNGGT